MAQGMRTAAGRTTDGTVPGANGSETVDGSEPAASTGLDGFTREELHAFLADMLLYRRFEEKAEEAYAIGKIGGFCHLHIGQEGLAAGSIKPLRDDDLVITAYREHTQAIAKGISPGAAMAELYGRVDGCSGGRGGSMHLFDTTVGFWGGPWDRRRADSAGRGAGMGNQVSRRRPDLPVLHG